MVKEMLVKSLAPGAPAEHARLARATRGLAFYATPHHGSWLADVGWNLRFLGASPAASVVHLKRGPQQEVECPLHIHRGLHSHTFPAISASVVLAMCLKQETGFLLCPMP